MILTGRNVFIWLWLTENPTQSDLNKPGVYFPVETKKSGTKRARPQELLRGFREPSNLPPDLGHPSWCLWPHWCSPAKAMPWDAPVVSAGKRQGNKNVLVCFFTQDFAFLCDKEFCLLELPSVFLWPLFATRDSGKATSFLASLVEVGKEVGSQNGCRVIQPVVSPQRAKQRALWQKFQVVPDAKASLCQRLWPALITARNLDDLVMLMWVEFPLGIVWE